MNSSTFSYNIFLPNRLGSFDTRQSSLTFSVRTYESNFETEIDSHERSIILIEIDRRRGNDRDLNIFRCRLDLNFELTIKMNIKIPWNGM